MKAHYFLLFFFLFSLSLSAQKKTIDLLEAGNLSLSFEGEDEISQLRELVLTGEMNAKDFKFIRDQMPFLSKLDFSGVVIVEYTGNEGTASTNTITYLANVIPEQAFYVSNGQSQLTEVVFPTTIEGIGTRAFKDCSKLRGDLLLPATLSFLGEEAYKGCSSLNSINLQDCHLLESINNSAFANCGGINRVEFGPSITGIDNYAFQNCSALVNELIFPESLIEIGDYAFSGCYSIREEITFPENLASLGAYAFRNCNLLTSCRLNSLVPPTVGNNAFDGTGLAIVVVPDGALEVYEASTPWNTYTLIDKMIQKNVHVANAGGLFKAITDAGSIPEEITHLTITGNLNTTDFEIIRTRMNLLYSIDLSGTSVTKIAENSFQGKKIISIKLPQNLLIIGDAAFQDCKSLSGYIDLPASLKTVSASSFKNCSALTSVSFSNEINQIGAEAFSGCTGLENVDFTGATQLTYIDSRAFYNSGIKGSLRLPNSIGVIGDRAFYSCKRLTSVVFPTELVALNSEAFRDCENITFLDFSGCGQLTQLNSYQFANCTSLRDIKFPSNLSELEAGVFQSCTSLAELNLPNTLRSIGNSVFSNCESLSGDLVFPPLLREIGTTAFYRCNQLTSITLPASVNSIGQSAFSNCSGLNRIILEGDTPPALNSNDPFNGIDKNACKIIVPPTAIESYKLASGWNVFASIEGTNVLEPVHKTINLTVPGTLSASLTGVEKETITHLTLTGTIDARDFKTMRDEIALLSVLDISQVVITNYSGDAGTVTGTQTYLKDVIPQYAFYNSATQNVKNTLTEISFPTSITVIGQYAFQGCRGLDSIILPSGVTKIEAYAFKECSSITKVELPSRVSFIENEAFNYCSKLSTINFPVSLQSIGNKAFANCNALVSVKLLSSVNYLGNEAFAYCKGLSNLDMSEMNSISSLSGYLFRDCTGLTTVKFSEALLSIDSYTFVNCTGLTTLNFPSKLTSISNYAFSGCTGLNEIELPLLVTAIGNYAFYGCTNLSKLTLSPALTSIGNSAFSSCRALSTIVLKTSTPPTIETSSNQPFSGVNKEMCKLEVFSDAVETYKETAGWNEFVNIQGTAEMDKIEKILHIEQPGTLMALLDETELKTTTHLTLTGNIDARDFKTMRDDMLLLTDINLEGTFIINYAGELGTQQGTQTYLKDVIPQRAFYNKQLTSIELPATITGIADEAFFNSRGIKNVSLPATVKTISTGAFSGCIRLTTVVLPAVLTAIEANAFQDCSKLTTINFPVALTTIGNRAFRGCSSLAEITLPASLHSIGGEAFRNCTGLYRADMGLCENITGFTNYEFYGCVGLTEIVFPPNLTTISGYAFANCTGLISMNLPAKLTQITSYAFSGCSSLSEVILPSLTSSIGDYAFYNCTGLTKITLSPALKSVGNNAFYSCSGLTTIISKAATPPSADTNSFNGVRKDVCKLNVLPESLEAYQASSVWKDFTDILGDAVMDKIEKIIFVEVPGSLNTLLTDYELKTVTHLTLSGTINAKDFKTIRDDMQLLAEVDIAAAKIANYTGSEGTVAGNQTYLEDIIPAYALNGKRITGILLPETLVSIDNYAFNNCSGLSTISLPDPITSIGDYAFNGCSRMISVKLPSLLRTIGNYSFENCVKLQSITFPETLTSIGERAFRYDASLGEVTLPTTLANLGNEAFRDCKGLYKLDMSESRGITSLASSQFRGCIGLNEILFPQTLSIIGSYAFEGCTGLTELSLPVYLTSIDSYAFANCRGLKGLYIPALVETIGNYAFSGCTNMTSITTPAALNQLGTYAFNNCTSLSQIILKGNTPPYISNYWSQNMEKDVCELLVPMAAVDRYKVADGWREFSKIRGLADTEVVIKAINVATAGTLKNELTAVERRTVTNLTVSGSIDARDFKTLRDEMPLLAVLDLSKANVMAYSGNEGTARNSADYPANYIPQYAFWNSETQRPRKSIDQLILPESIIGIEQQAMSGCRGISSIVIPEKVTFIGSYAFYNCMWMESVEFSENLTTIASYAFNGCSTLDNITIPSKVTIIGENAFRDCTALSEIALPSTLSTLDTGSFRGCSALRKVDLSQSTLITQLNNAQFRDCVALIDIRYPATLTKMGNQAFYNCVAIPTLNLPVSLQTIESSAFEGCTGLTEVDCPPLLTTIGSYAFARCTALTKFTMPAGIKSVGDYAFSNCTELIQIVVKNMTPPTANTYSFNGVRTNICELNVPIGTMEAYQAANVWKEFTKAFETEKVAGTLTLHVEEAGTLSELLSADSKDELTHLTLTGSIDARDFKTMRDEMEQLSIIDLTNVTILGYVGENGTSLSGRYPANTIPECAFYNEQTGVAKSSLILLLQPQNLTAVDKMAFKDCDGLSSVPFVQSLTTIGENAYALCDNIGSVIIPKNVSQIGNRAFAECSQLSSFLVDTESKYYTSVSGVLYSKSENRLQQYPAAREGAYVVSSNTSEIAAYAFEGSSKLTSVYLPASVVSIGDFAFRNCSRLAVIEADAVVYPQPGIGVFENVNTAICELKIPAGSLTSYQEDEQWGAFIHITEVGEVQKWAFIASEAVKTYRQTSITIPVTLNSNDLVKSLVVEITIPSGMELDLNVNDQESIQALLNSGMIEDHSMSITRLATNKYKLELMSETAASLKATEGLLFDFPVNILRNAIYGTHYFEVENMEIVGQSGLNIAVTPRISPIEVVRTFEYGDVNNDGVINVLDVVATVNYIAGNTPENFLVEAADVNQDSEVNIFDVVHIVNLVLGKEENAVTAQQGFAKVMVYDGQLWVNSNVNVAGVQYEYSRGKENYTQVLYSMDGTIAEAGYRSVGIWDNSHNLTAIILSDEDGNPIQTEMATSLQDMEMEPFSVYANKEAIIVTGLIPGSSVELYTMSGMLIFREKAIDTTMNIQLNGSEMLIIRCGGKSLKVNR